MSRVNFGITSKARFPGDGLIPSIKSTLPAQGSAFFASFLIKASFIRGLRAKLVFLVMDSFQA
jgi:hypothetical protein